MLGFLVLTLLATVIKIQAQFAGQPCTSANLTPWPVPGNMNNYFMCMGGTTVEMTCPGGNIFVASSNSNVFGCVPPTAAIGYYPNSNSPNENYPSGNYPNGYYPNGYYPNGYNPNGYNPNGYYPNGYNTNGYNTNGYYPNGNYPTVYYPNNSPIQYYPNMGYLPQ